MAGLESHLLAKLELLRVATRRVHAGRYAARTRSKRLGAGVDFADHRAYSPGDDLKHVDWKLFGRLDQLMIRLSEEETELHVHLLVDTSRSMGLFVGDSRGDTKAHVARLAATALAYVALSNLDAVRVWPYGEGLGKPLSLDRRPSEITRVWERLGEASAGSTNLDLAAQQFLATRPHRGVVIVLSDGHDPTTRTALDRIRHARFDVGAVQILTPGELSLPLEGERFDLEDGETGELLRGVTRADLERVRTRIATEQRDLQRWCRQRAIPWVATTTGEPTDIEALVLDLFRKRGLLR